MAGLLSCPDLCTVSGGNSFWQASGSVSKEDVINTAGELLRKKALANGSTMDDFEMETLEELEFNIIRGFNTVGKNIRVKVQVKPGLIHGYKPIGNISAD